VQLAICQRTDRRNLSVTHNTLTIQCRCA